MPKLRQVRGHCGGQNKDLLHAQTSSGEGALWGTKQRFIACPSFVRWGGIVGDQTKIYCMPKLPQLRGHYGGGGHKTKIYCKEMYVGDASLLRYGPPNWVRLRLEIKQNHLSIPNQKVVCSTNLQLMFKRAPTDRRTQLTTTHQRLTWALINAMLLPDGYRCLYDRANKIHSVSSPNRHLQRSLDWTGRADGLASQVTRPQTNGPLFLWGNIKLLKPNDIYICRTAALTSRRYILNIYSTNTHTEYFKHAA